MKRRIIDSTKVLSFVHTRIYIMSFKNLFTPPKKVELDLASIDGNAFTLLEVFSETARHAGWSDDEIQLVITKCKSSDFENLYLTLKAHTISKF